MAETLINPNQINLGNESALDLLVEQNKAKTDLANNLNGLGISANANTDTLEELAYKVSTASVDSLKQKPKCIAINTSNYNGIDASVNHFLTKNGWLFSRKGTAFRYKKLSAMKTKVTSYDSGTATNLVMSTKSVTNRTLNYNGEGIGQNIFFNADGSYLFVLTNTTILRYGVQNYNTDTLSIDSSATTLTPKFNNASTNIQWIDINDAGTQILITDDSGNVGIFDLTGSNTQNITPIYSGEGEDVWFFTNNASNDVVRIANPSETNFYISFFEYSNNTIGSQIGSTIEIVRESYHHQFLNAICKYKDSNNKYRLFINACGINNNSEPSFIMIDCYSRNVTNIFCKINKQRSSSFEYAYTVTVTEVGTYKYVLSGLLLAVFDENWNLVGNCINRLGDIDEDMSLLYQTLLYDGDIFDFNDYNDNKVIYSAIKHKTWLDKLVAYERTVTINGNTKNLVYFSSLNATDLNDGYYNN